VYIWYHSGNIKITMTRHDLQKILKYSLWEISMGKRNSRRRAVIQSLCLMLLELISISLTDKSQNCCVDIMCFKFELKTFSFCVWVSCSIYHFVSISKNMGVVGMMVILSVERFFCWRESHENLHYIINFDCMRKKWWACKISLQTNVKQMIWFRYWNIV
jgi:hypothetical protein